MQLITLYLCSSDILIINLSCVLLQSLKQCMSIPLTIFVFDLTTAFFLARERWLSKTFPRFSSRSRGNKDPAPPPHTIQTRGRCDLVIGPHIFPDTVFYEVHYLPPQGSQPSSFSTQPLAANPYWQSSSSYTSSYPQNVTAGSSTQTPQTDSTTVATPVKGVSSSLNSIPSSITLTPNLIQQVNSAASSNPILANLLQIAAAGKATQDQLKTLGLLIQSFATLSSTSSTTQAQLAPSTFLSLGSYQRASILPLVKEFDLVFEFHETPNDRWFIPRVPIYTERKPPPDQPNDLDISLLTCVPFNADKTSQTEGQTTTENPVQYPVTFVLKNAPFTIWETIWRWIGGEDKNKANKVELESQVRSWLFIAHGIPHLFMRFRLHDYILATSCHQGNYLPNSKQYV